MKKIMKDCPTCDGLGLVKMDVLGEVHPIEFDTFWCEEAHEYLELTEEICQDCEGLGKIDITDRIEVEKTDERIKNY